MPLRTGYEGSGAKIFLITCRNPRREQVMREKSQDGIVVFVAPTKALINQIAAQVHFCHTATELITRELNQLS